MLLISPAIANAHGRFVRKDSATMVSAQTRGLVVGLVLGIVWMWLGFGAALLTGGIGLLGWLVGTVAASVAAGNLNVADLWSDLQGRRRAES
jgi:Mg/Co/Ni transporter MgtE